MTERERLVKLIEHIVIPYYAEQIADHLLDNGIIVPPCNVGDELFVITIDYKRVKSFRTRSLSHIAGLIEDDCFGRWVFLTKEEAERELERRTHD